MQHFSLNRKDDRCQSGPKETPSPSRICLCYESRSHRSALRMPHGYPFYGDIHFKARGERYCYGAMRGCLDRESIEITMNTDLQAGIFGVLVAFQLLTTQSKYICFCGIDVR